MDSIWVKIGMFCFIMLSFIGFLNLLSGLIEWQKGMGLKTDRLRLELKAYEMSFNSVFNKNKDNLRVIKDDENKDS